MKLNNYLLIVLNLANYALGLATPQSSMPCSTEGSFQCSNDGMSLMQCSFGNFVMIPCGMNTRCLAFNQNGVTDYECVASNQYDSIVAMLQTQAGSTGATAISSNATSGTTTTSSSPPTAGT